MTNHILFSSLRPCAARDVIIGDLEYVVEGIVERRFQFEALVIGFILGVIITVFIYRYGLLFYHLVVVLAISRLFKES